MFMSLAWTMARGFPLLVPLYGSVGKRQIVKLSYDAYRYRPRTQWRSAHIAGKMIAKAVQSASRWPGGWGENARKPSDGEETGRLLLRIAWHAGSSSTLTEPASTPRVKLKLVNPGGAERAVEIVGSETLVDGLAQGRWYVQEQPIIDGYEPEEAVPRSALVIACTTSDLRLAYREEPKRVVSSKPPMDFGRDSRLWWLLEEIGMTSRRALFVVRIERSGSCHFEFEAPGGFVVTRVKLSTTGSKGRVLDMSARSSHRASVYALSAAEPTRAIVLANIRPRSDTMVDLSWVTALVTAGVLTAYAVWHLVTGRAPSDATTVLLAAPGALAAFAAQPPREVIVSRMTAGLRYFSLLPGLVAFAAAATTMAWPMTLVGEIIECCLAAVAGGIALLWTITHWWTRRPPERRWTQGPQRGHLDGADGDGIGRHASPDSRLESIKREIESECGDDALWAAYRVRARLREETQPIDRDLVDEYLIQQYGMYRTKRPPSVFVDSGEVGTDIHRALGAPVRRTEGCGLWSDDDIGSFASAIDALIGGHSQRRRRPPRSVHSVSADGVSSNSRIRARNWAASAPYRIRWSHTSVSVIVWRTTIAPSRTTARGSSTPTDRIAACGGLTIAVKLRTPNMPRFDTVKVPPPSSGGVIVPARTRSASARVSRAISPSDFSSASKTVGTTSASSAATATPTFTRECSCSCPSR